MNNHINSYYYETLAFLLNMIFKPFIFQSGRKVFVQGFEPFALRLLERSGISDKYIITGHQFVPIIYYMDENKKIRKHFPDIYINKYHQLVEVKSRFTFEKNIERNLAKKTGAEKLGFNYDIWIFNKNGKLIHKI